MAHIYLTAALRHLARDWKYSAINVCGLAVGMACVVLIGSLVRHESLLDRHVPYADRIYRVLLQRAHHPCRSGDGSAGRMTVTVRVPVPHRGVF